MGNCWRRRPGTCIDGILSAAHRELTGRDETEIQPDRIGLFDRYFEGCRAGLLLVIRRFRFRRAIAGAGGHRSQPRQPVPVLSTGWCSLGRRLLGVQR